MYPPADAPIARTAEMVTDGHPDKFRDQVADRLVDEFLRQDPWSRAAIECLAKDYLLVIAGEVRSKAEALDIAKIARDVWANSIGCGNPGRLKVVNYLRPQSDDVARGVPDLDKGRGVDFGGAGDQGVMIGYATAETPDMMPLEYTLARSLCERLKDLRQSGRYQWLRPDGKSQITFLNGEISSIVLAAQHTPDIGVDEVRRVLRDEVVDRIAGPDVPRTVDCRVVINGTGRFVNGGTLADTVLVGRKLVADAYGPRIAIGGGACSGKDPSKIDRSAAYMARHIAKAVVGNGMAAECTVIFAFAIGQRQPESLGIITRPPHPDASRWVREHFRDLRPDAIVEYLDLRWPVYWSYQSTAAFGHYGRKGFPWERVAQIQMEKPSGTITGLRRRAIKPVRADKPE